MEERIKGWTGPGDDAALYPESRIDGGVGAEGPCFRIVSPYSFRGVNKTVEMSASGVADGATEALPRFAADMGVLNGDTTAPWRPLLDCMVDAFRGVRTGERRAPPARATACPPGSSPLVLLLKGVPL